MNDLRYALRVFRRSKQFSATVVLVLAVGVGATTALFSLVRAVLLRPLPYPNADRLVALWETHPMIGKQEVAFPDFSDWSNGLRSFDRLAAYTMRGHVDFIMEGTTPERVSGTLASPELFPLLGVDAALGRVFGPDDGRAGPDPVVLLSDALWRRAFRANPSIVGQSIRLNGQPYFVLGVLPTGLEVGSWADVWLPISRLQALAREQRQWHLLHVIGRLRTDVPPSQVDAEFQSVVRRLQVQYPVTNKATGGMLVPLQADLAGQARSLLPILFAATGLVLIIGCANAATLISTRAVARRHELLLRLALGGSRSQLLRQVAAESLVLAVSGGLGGCLSPLPRWVRSGPSRRDSFHAPSTSAWIR